MSKSKEQQPRRRQQIVSSNFFLLLVNFCVIVFLIYKRYEHLQQLDKEEEKNVGYYEFVNQIYNICLIYNLLLVFDLENTNLKLISFFNCLFLIMIYTEFTPTTSKEFTDKTILYTKLGVEPNANEKEIKKSYRELLKIYHPDKCKSDECKMRVRQLNLIHEVLTKEEPKKQYDDKGTFTRDICYNEIDDPKCKFTRLKKDENEFAYYPLEKSWWSSFLDF